MLKDPGVYVKKNPSDINFHVHKNMLLKACVYQGLSFSKRKDEAERNKG